MKRRTKKNDILKIFSPSFAKDSFREKTHLSPNFLRTDDRYVKLMAVAATVSSYNSVNLELGFISVILIYPLFNK